MSSSHKKETTKQSFPISRTVNFSFVFQSLRSLDCIFHKDIDFPNNLTIKDFRQGAHHLSYCSLENVKVGKESSSSSLLPPEFSPSKDSPSKKPFKLSRYSRHASSNTPQPRESTEKLEPSTCSNLSLKETFKPLLGIPSCFLSPNCSDSSPSLPPSLFLTSIPN